MTLPDNVTGTQFAVHLGKFNDKSKPRLLRALTPELHMKWIIDRLPEKLSADQRNIRRTLRATGKAADVTEAMKQCVVEACDDAYDPTIGLPDVGACMSKRLGAVRNHFQAGAVEVRFYPPGSNFIGFEPGIQSLQWSCKVCKVSSFSLSSFYDRVLLIAGVHRGATWCLRRRYGTQGGWVAQSERPPAHGLHRHRWDGSFHATWQGLHFGWC